MSSGPIPSWQRDGETTETVRDFIFLDSKITAEDVCSSEMKRCLLLGRKAATTLNSVLEGGDITLPTKAHTATAVVSPAVKLGHEEG